MSAASHLPGGTIRDAVADDFAAIEAIYAHHVLEGFASFELEPPDRRTLQERWRGVLEAGLPYLVAEIDGTVCGYAYALPYRPRRAYRYTVENSIYVSPDHLRRGIGAALIETLAAVCTDLGYRQMIAAIGGPDNKASMAFHAAHGFLPAGTLPAVGYKFDRWIDSILMIRTLGEGAQTPPR